MLATPTDFQRLQMRVGALAEQTSWFIERLKEDDDSDTENATVEPIASTSSAHPGPDETNAPKAYVLLSMFRAWAFFQLSDLGCFGYGLGLRFWVVFAIIVSFTLTITLITTLNLP